MNNQCQDTAAAADNGFCELPGVQSSGRFAGFDILKSICAFLIVCKFRHLLEVNGLNKLFFDAINRVMVQTGHMMKGGTIVDAAIINAPSSTKNADKARDPERRRRAASGNLA